MLCADICDKSFGIYAWIQKYLTSKVNQNEVPRFGRKTIWSTILYRLGYKEYVKRLQQFYDGNAIHDWHCDKARLVFAPEHQLVRHPVMICVSFPYDSISLFWELTAVVEITISASQTTLKSQVYLLVVNHSSACCIAGLISHLSWEKIKFDWQLNRYYGWQCHFFT